MLSEIEISGDVVKINFRNEENGWTVLRLQDEKDHQNFIPVTGSFTQIAEGQYVCLLGNWSLHKTYGKQFIATNMVPPTTLKGIRKYLASRSIPGLGDKTAKKIVEYFRLDTLEVLDNTPDRLKEVASIGRKKTMAIIDAWDEFRQTRQIELFLINQDLSPRLALEIIRIYGYNAISLIMKNPYRLAHDIRGIGFISADALALKVGIAPDSSERIEAAITYLLEIAEESGHCFQTTQQIFVSLCDQLKLKEDIVTERLPQCLNKLSSSGYIATEQKIVADQEGTKESCLIHYKYDLYNYETSSAKNLRQFLAQENSIHAQDVEQFFYVQKNASRNIVLSEEQLNAVREAAKNKIFILTGGPGVGKTTTANMIIEMLKFNGYSFALAAPTGRAAQRLSESTGYPAKTIHRLLEWNPEIAGFNRNGDNKLLANAIVIDEASMIDIRLFHALIESIPDNAKLIIIGDIDQLPSVGPGNVLADLISSRQISYVRLSQIFRQAAASYIIRAAHKINQGLMPEFIDSKESDCRFIETQSADDVIHTIKELVSKILPQKRNVDPVRDIQILTPMNRGPIGTATLNSVLQDLLNPLTQNSFEHKKDEASLRIGDKVIQTVNNYKLGVFNGDIGYVAATGLSEEKIIINFDDRQIIYEKSEAKDLTLAYAITIHKSQGSEFPITIIPVTMQHYIMLQRNLIYTALTRARKLAIFVGSKKALAFAISQVKTQERQTKLAERIIDSSPLL